MSGGGVSDLHVTTSTWTVLIARAIGQGSRVSYATVAWDNEGKAKRS